MLHDLQENKLSPVLTTEEVTACTALGETIRLEQGAALYREGVSNQCVHVVLSGHLRIFRTHGGEDSLLAVLGPGEFSGEISLFTGGPPQSSATAIGSTTLARLCPVALKKLIAGESTAGDVILGALARRSQQVGLYFSQEEKLAALGKMSAGLAHELNNPAAAARRAASLMLEAVLDIPRKMIKLEKSYTPEQRETVLSLIDELQKRAKEEHRLDPLELSDREQDLLDWLEQRGMTDVNELAATLACNGITSIDLDSWTAMMNDNFVKAVYWTETVLRLGGLARDIETSTGRIRELVLAMKEYTYMDQAKFQEVDVHHGLDNTIKILHHKLKKGVEVKREYGANLPKICAYAGELNQVWTNIIDNAIDAMGGHGVLTIRTSQEEERIFVQICDNGPGIPPEIQRRIFEPFFTTKPVGEGTGLGLDICYRIITHRHGGEIQVRSKPGCTCFDIYLLRNPPKEAELVATGHQQERL